MAQTYAQQIFESIAQDDAKTFSALVDDNKAGIALCFGRFPILSLCYLYKSKKIVKNHERQLSNVFTYTYVDEPVEAYKKFRQQAQKSLRLYVFDDQIVTPLEMLAVCGEAAMLEQRYKSFNKSGKIKSNIGKIFKSKSGWSSQASDFEIKVKKPLPKFQKLFAILAVTIALLMTVLPVSALVFASNTFGLGTSRSPAHIATLVQLEQAFEAEEKYFALTQDITLPSDWDKAEFNGHLDGNGHTVTLVANPQKGFVAVLNGSLSNINFELQADGAISISNNTGFVVATNNGTIEGATVNLSAKMRIASRTTDDIYVSALVHQNNGQILSSTANVDLEILGDEVNSYLCTIASINSGTVDNCTTSSGSTLTTTIVDVCGIVAQNTANGVVSNCTNNAEILQSSSSNAWLPNVAGLVLTNLGKVVGCSNLGKLTASSSGAGENLELYVGGIVCTNQGQIEKCKNNADLTASSQSVTLVVGAIVALNRGSSTTAIATVTNCGGFGSISASSGEQIGIFGGGIAGYSNAFGAVVDCFAAATFISQGAIQYLGGIIGMCVYEYSANLDGQLTYYSRNINNFYVTQANAQYGVARFVIDNYYPASDELYDRCTAVATLQQLQDTEVYWQ